MFFHLPIFSENENKTTENMGGPQKTCSIDNAIHRMQGGVLSHLKDLDDFDVCTLSCHYGACKMGCFDETSLEIGSCAIYSTQEVG